MGFKARRKPQNTAPVLAEMSSVRNIDEIQSGVEIYAAGLIDYLVDYEIEAADIFDSDDLQIFDEEDQALIHFSVGYITCAAALFEVNPLDIINGFIASGEK